MGGTFAGGFAAVEGLAVGFVGVVAAVLGGTIMGVLACCSRTPREWRKSA